MDALYALADTPEDAKALRILMDTTQGILANYTPEQIDRQWKGLYPHIPLFSDVHLAQSQDPMIAVTAVFFRAAFEAAVEEPKAAAAEES